MAYRMGGKLDEKALQQAIELSQNKYRFVAATLNKYVAITYRYEIVAEA
jgi:uncharacterized OsmC-like protein